MQISDVSTVRRMQKIDILRSLPQPLASTDHRLPVAEFHIYVRKEGPGPELHGDAGSDDHWFPETKKLAAASLDRV